LSVNSVIPSEMPHHGSGGALRLDGGALDENEGNDKTTRRKHDQQDEQRSISENVDVSLLVQVDGGKVHTRSSRARI
jgi:hypothetical protein